MRRTLFLTAAVPLLVLVGGGGAVASAAPAAATLAPMTDPDPSDDPEERIRQFVECMRDNGIDLPDPTGADGPVHFEIGPDREEAFDEALKACDAFAPPHGRTVELDPAQRAQVEEFHECLSEHGVDLPEPGRVVLSQRAEAGEQVGPVLHEDGPGAPRPGVPAPDEAHLLTPFPGSEEAVEACKDLLPGDGPFVVGSGTSDVVVGEAGVAPAGAVGVAPASGIGIAVAGGGR